jgi:DNA-binding transcriptional regulator YhcF (GntR family)
VTTRWEVERAVLTSDLAPQLRLVALTLLAMTDQDNAIIPAQYTPSLSRIQAMTGQSAATVKRALNELETGGWVIRRRPDPAKARADKERTRYALKVPKAGLTQSLARPTESLGLGSERATGLGSHRATSHTAIHTRTKQQEPAGPEALIRERTGATAEEAAAIVARIQNERQPKSLGGFIRHLADAGDLAQFLVEQRAASVKAEARERDQQRRKLPPCDHGENGGDQLHPISGEPWCIDCRFQHRAKRLNNTARNVIQLHPRETA